MRRDPATRDDRRMIMTRLLKRLAAILLGSMFAMTAVSFGDFLACNSEPGARIEDERGRQPGRPKRS